MDFLKIKHSLRVIAASDAFNRNGALWIKIERSSLKPAKPVAAVDGKHVS